MRSWWLAVAVPLVLGACGSPSPAVEATSSAQDEGPIEYAGVALVVENAEHGPQLCFGEINAVMPPQCGGPDIVGWSWDEVTGYESSGETTYGGFVITGTYDGTTFTLTEPATSTSDPASEKPVRPRPPTPDFTTSCSPPDGGWAIMNPATTTDKTLHAAFLYAEGQADFGVAWSDESFYDDPRRRPNDPEHIVLNARFTSDLKRHEAELRAIWGGALCVDKAQRSQRELQSIADELTGDANVLSASGDAISGVLNLDVIVDDGLQARLDETYGEGVVRVWPALMPVSS